MAEEIRLDVVSVAHSRGLTDAARDVKGLRRESDEMGRSFRRSTQETFDFDRAVLHAQTSVKKLNDEFKRTGDTALFKDMRRARAELSQLMRIGGNAGGFGAALAEGFGSMPFRTKAIAALVGLAVVAAPAIGAIVSGAVVGLTSVGGVAGGIAAASKDPRVRSAAKDFGKSISKEFFGSGEAFVQPTIRALDILKKDFAALDLKSAFAPGAEAVEILAHGVGNFAKEIMPGFNRVMERSPQLASIMADGFGNVGDAISDMLIVMIESEGTMEGLRALFTLTAGVVRGFGNVSAFLADSFHLVNSAAAGVTGAMEDWFGWWPIIGQMLRDTNDRAEEWAGTGEDVINVMHRAAPGQAAINRAMAAGIPVVLTSGLTWTEYEKRVRAANDALDTLIDTQFGVDNANLAVNKGLMNLRESLKENGHHWETNTQKGLANRDALLSQVEALDRQRRANIKAGVDADVAAAAFNRELRKLETLARNARISESALRDLVGNYKVTITTTRINRHLNFTSNYLQPGDLQGRQGGGHVSARQPVVVGERRPEVFVPSTSGHVYPSVGAFGASGGSLGRSAARPLLIQPGNRLVQVVVEEVAREVERRGGRLAVLGLKDI